MWRLASRSDAAEAGGAAATRGGEGAAKIACDERLRRALPERGPKRALLFTVVAGVALGSVLAAQYWMQEREARRSAGR